jgi:hypothetical protein
VVGCLQVAARRHRLQLENIEAVVSAELNNALTYLGVVGESGHPGVERISITTYVESLASPDQVRVVWDEALARSPLVHTFKSLCTLELQLKLVP